VAEVFMMRQLRWFLALTALAVADVAWAQQRFDVLVVNGTVYDGSGAEGRRADVGIRDGKVAAIGNLNGASAARTIDASGLAVAPGFIDMHNHSDNTLLAEPNCESMIRQGVTTMVLGEGGSAGPVKPGSDPWTTLGGYFDHVDKHPASTNICSYVGETQVWTYVKGDAMTPATAAEMEAMKREVEKAMLEGAMGLSTSLLMPPSNLITTAQLVDLAKVAKKHGGIYSSHIRDEGAGVFRSVEEAINVGKGAGIRVDVIHLKIADKAFWGQMSEVVAMIRKAREEGHDIRANVYPYTAGQNNLRAIIPPWAHDGGNEKMLERLRDPEMRARMRRDILNGLPNWYNHYLATGGGWEGMLLVSFSQEKNKPFVGKRMSELIAARGGDPVDVLFDVLLERCTSITPSPTCSWQ
jgi:N-acyl-D-aspartate/D-glutamate deacylase